MNFDFVDTEVQTFLLRVLATLLVLWVSIELYRWALAVDNYRLTTIFWKAALTTGLFFLFRIFAGILDNFLAYSVGWFSTLVNIIFWSILGWKARNIRLVLSSPRSSEIRQSLRSDIDAFIIRLEQARDSAKKLNPIK